MANGDFSSVAGTYQNDLGDTITVSPSGSVTRVGAESGYSDTSSQLFNGFAQDGGWQVLLMMDQPVTQFSLTVMDRFVSF
ncbi:MAG: DUF6287 domain-containing protein [Streptococcus sp.]